MLDHDEEKINRLNQQFAFIREIDKEKFIGRQTYLTDAKRKENDAEHAWHMAIMTLLLSEYANQKIDVLKTISMLLIHDLVEIDAVTPMHMMKREKRRRRRENRKLLIVYMVCCQRTRAKSYMICGLNLKRRRHQKPSLHVRWTIYSLCT